MRFISSMFSTNPKRAITNIDDVKHIQSDDIFHRYDVFELEDMAGLFEHKGFPAVFVSDHVTHYEDFFSQVKFLGLPMYLENERKRWTLDEFVDVNITTHNCFNFMINKKQVNRHLCIKLVELFGFKNFIYTYSGVDNNFDCSDIVREHQLLGERSPLSPDQFGKILAPITTDARFYNPSQQDVDSMSAGDQYESHTAAGHSGVSKNAHGNNRHHWEWGCKELFLTSAVSLITESLHYQKASTFTEKTLFALLGLNFPIWVGGGNRQAEQWKKIGFDTFDDVINHDYQHCDTLLERCVYAITQNLQILSDLEYATSMREKHLSRLENNRRLILSGQLGKYIDAKVETELFADRDDTTALKQFLQKIQDR